MPDLLTKFLAEFWSILLDSGVWLVFGFLLAGVVHALVPVEWVRRHLGGRGVWPIAKASLLGLPMPLCSCSVIPVAASLRGAGAGKGASAAFSISTPQTGEESIPLTWALFGPVFAIVRPVAAIITAFVAGSLIEVFGGEEETAEEETERRRDEETKCCANTPQNPTSPSRKRGDTSCCAHTSEPRASARAVMDENCCCSNEVASTSPERTRGDGSSCCVNTPTESPQSVGARIADALRYGLLVLPRDLAPWLIAGLALAALVAAIVPAGWIGENLGTGIVPMLIVLVAGVPLYICATSATPLAASLVAAGLSPGAALVLLMAGPATNTATMAWVLKDLGARALAVYIAVIAVMALGFGILFDTVFTGAVRLADHAVTHEHGVISTTMTLGAIALAIVLGLALVRRFGGGLFAKKTPAKSCCCAD